MAIQSQYVAGEDYWLPCNHDIFPAVKIWLCQWVRAWVCLFEASERVVVWWCGRAMCCEFLVYGGS
jgi:hypothetical protein